MQDRPNYQYNDYNSLKDPNQQGQNPNKQGKKSNQHKNYKGGYNKNNNIDEMNLNNNDHNQNYRHRYPGNNYVSYICCPNSNASSKALVFLMSPLSLTPRTNTRPASSNL